MQVQPSAQAPVRCDSGNCSPAVVLGMIQQGVNGQTGTQAGPVEPGIAYYLTVSKQPVGAALRSYNSGHLINAADYSVATNTSTESYVSDIANRLKGFPPASFPSQKQLSCQCGFRPATGSR